MYSGKEFDRHLHADYMISNDLLPAFVINREYIEIKK